MTIDWDSPEREPLTSDPRRIFVVRVSALIESYARVSRTISPVAVFDAGT